MWVIAVALSWLVAGGMLLGSADVAIRTASLYSHDVKPHAMTHVNGALKYSYDLNGNLTSRDGATQTYDAENRLASVNQDGRVTTFVYDADGQRVKKETPWGTTYYVGEHYEKYVPAAGLSVLPGDANADCRVSTVDVQLIAARWGEKWGGADYDKKLDIDQDGAVTAGDLQATAANWRASVAGPCTNIPVVIKYYRLGGRVVALRQNGLLRYVHTDHLGSVSLLTDESGKVVPGSVQRFMPFGKVRTGQPVLLPTGRNFIGQLLDVNTGLLYYGSAAYGRYYDPALGRFIQPDTLVQADTKNPRPYLPLTVSYANPKTLDRWNRLQRARLQPEAQGSQIPSAFDPQFLNRYTYTRNNPLAYVDDSGHIAWWIVGGVVGGVVGFGAYAVTHRDNFDWREAALWTGGGVVVGATFGAGAQWVAGALGTEAAVTAGAAASPWALPVLQRGQVIEDMLGRSPFLACFRHLWASRGHNGSHRVSPTSP